jgi:hypothetical protein
VLVQGLARVLALDLVLAQVQVLLLGLVLGLIQGQMQALKQVHMLGLELGLVQGQMQSRFICWVSSWVWFRVKCRL